MIKMQNGKRERQEVGVIELNQKLIESILKNMGLKTQRNCLKYECAIMGNLGRP